MGKWIAGIVAAVIAAVIGAWMMSPGGPLNPQKPDVTITSFNVQNGVAGNAVNAYFEAENDGDGTAQACVVLWYSHGYDFDPRRSVSFGLSPGESQSLTVTSWVYDTSGVYTSYARIVCANDASDQDWSSQVLIS
jgi:hypothetical protein